MAVLVEAFSTELLFGRIPVDTESGTSSVSSPPPTARSANKLGPVNFYWIPSGISSDIIGGKVVGTVNPLRFLVAVE